VKFNATLSASAYWDYPRGSGSIASRTSTVQLHLGGVQPPYMFMKNDSRRERNNQAIAPGVESILRRIAIRTADTYRECVSWCRFPARLRWFEYDGGRIRAPNERHGQPRGIRGLFTERRHQTSVVKGSRRNMASALKSSSVSFH